MEPVKGTEPGEHGRPCIVLTDELYNKSGRVIVMMISTSIRGTALEVPLDDLHRTGVFHCPSVLCADLVRHVDWSNLRQIGKLGMDEYLEAIGKMGALVFGN